MNLGKIKLGKKIVVSDPCYGFDTSCVGILKNMVPGFYECEINYSDEDEWGNRVASIEIIHENAISIGFRNTTDFEVLVDSGQAGFFDYNYYKKFHSNKNKDKNNNEEWYDRVCDITLSRLQGGTIDKLGFVSSSGFGDGGYVCYYSKNLDNKIDAVCIEFITHNYEDYDLIDEDEILENN
jgi:hypothetical protein